MKRVLHRKNSLKEYFIVSFLLLSFFTLNLFMTEHPSVVYGDDQWYDYAAAQFAGGNGSIDSPFLIATPEQLARMNYLINILHQHSESSFKLVSDIDLAGKNWHPIGEEIVFRGIFDGSNYTIKNMTISKPSLYTGDRSTNYAFIGYCRSATVKNITFLNARIEDNATLTTTAATVTGDTGGSTILENIYIINSYINTSAWSQGFVAGWQGRVKNCYISNGTLINNRSDSHIGGIVGTCYPYVENSFYSGQIDSACSASGVSGINDANSSIKNSGSYILSNSKNVSSGINHNSAIIINHCASNISLNNSNATIIDCYFGNGSNVPSSFYNEHWTSINNVFSGFPILKQFYWAAQ